MNYCTPREIPLNVKRDKVKAKKAFFRNSYMTEADII